MTQPTSLHAIPAEPQPKRWGYTMEALASAPMVFRDDLYAGQVVLVSGGGGGFGRAMTFLFARLGATVAICGRKPEKLAETADGVRRLLGRDAVITHPMTIRDPDQCTALIDDVWRRCGRLDLLVNNAGGQFPQAAIDFTPKGWLAVIDTNLNGTWYMMQAAARRWRDAGVPGSIVNIVANVWRGMPQVAHTCAARAGVIYLSKTLSTEWAPLKIRVNCVSPGSINSEGLNVYDPAAAAQFEKTNPMQTLGDAYDVGQAVAYLGAASAKFVTGEVLVVDGGNCQWGDVWPAGKPDYFKVGEP
jgi:NAD(P)-dependent dehydrogenase (short-subunit alcohol dehydrogenase family)